jgi:hypothetical protein
MYITPSLPVNAFHVYHSVTSGQRVSCIPHREFRSTLFIYTTPWHSVNACHVYHSVTSGERFSFIPLRDFRSTRFMYITPWLPVNAFHVYHSVIVINNCSGFFICLAIPSVWFSRTTVFNRLFLDPRVLQSLVIFYLVNIKCGMYECINDVKNWPLEGWNWDKCIKIQLWSYRENTTSSLHGPTCQWCFRKWSVSVLQSSKMREFTMRKRVCVSYRSRWLLLLYRHYKSLRVLVRSTIVLHESLPSTLLFQFLIFIFCRSILTSSEADGTNANRVMLSNASGVAVTSCLYSTQHINSHYFLDPLNITDSKP